MDQDSTNSGERRNWRERLGIAKDASKDLPKISEEFRSENGGKATEPRLVVASPGAGPSKPASSEAGQPASAGRGQGATPVRPAPMAPRPNAAGAPVRPPQNQHVVNQMPPQTPRAASPNGQAKPQPAAPSRAAGPPTPLRAPAPAPAAAANGSGAPASDDFADRLRQQREAAERLARQRAATARSQAVPPPLAKAPEAAPRFSFAPDELAADSKPAPAAAPPKAPQRPAAPANAGQQGWQPPFQAQPAPGQSAHAPPRSPGYPYGQQPYQPQRAAAPAFSRQPGQPAQPVAQAAAAYGQESWAGGETIARSAPPRPAVPQRADAYAAQPELGYGNVAEDVYADPARSRRAVAVAPRAPVARQRPIEAEEQEHEEGYEVERRSDARGIGRQRAQVADYNNAYREYDEEFAEEEPRGRGGPLILLLALLALALIVGVLIFFYTQKFNLPSSSASTANHEIPVIAAPEEPAKTTPEPQVDTPASGPAAASAAPPQPLQQGRKQIYDRILGEEAVEQNKLVPTEEQPVAPPRSNDSQDSGDTATGGGAPLPEPGSDAGPSPEPSSHDGTAPEPLPLPPPPGVQGRHEPRTPASGIEAVANASEPQTDPSVDTDAALIEPTSEQSVSTPEPSRSKAATGRGEQPSPSRVALASTSDAAKSRVSDGGATSEDSVGAVSASTSPARSGKPKAPPNGQAAETGAVVPPTESETIVDTLPPPPGAVAGQPSTLGAPMRLGQGQPMAPAGSSGYGGAPAAVPSPGAAQPAYIDQFKSQAQQSASATQRPRTGRDVDPLDGLRTPLSGHASAPQPPPQQLAMAEPPQGAGLPPPAPPPASLSGQGTAVLPPAQAIQAPAPRVQQPARVQPAPAARPQQQLAALTPATTPAVAGGTGYVVQLASFRSEAEAAGEFRRLQSRHPQLVGTLQQRIQRADLGASGTFYRLGVGPLGSKDLASRLCNSLIAAGEKDCLVRRQ